MKVNITVSINGRVLERFRDVVKTGDISNTVEWLMEKYVLRAEGLRKCKACGAEYAVSLKWCPSCEGW